MYTVCFGKEKAAGFRENAEPNASLIELFGTVLLGRLMHFMYVIMSYLALFSTLSITSLP